MKKSGILALDVGTSSIRASIYIKDEGMKHSLAMKHHLEERFIIDDLWATIAQLIKRVTGSIDDIFIEAIGVSSFLGWVIVNQNGEPLEKAWSWMAYGDQAELKKAKQQSGNSINEIIGRKLNEQLGVFYWGKIIRDLNDDAVILSVKDFINYKLTNIFMMDQSHASYSGLYSVAERRWDTNLFKEFDLPFTAAPALGYGHEVIGTVSCEIQSYLNVSSDTKVILGGPDGTLAILGGGGYQADCTVEVMGTTDVIFHVLDSTNTKDAVANGLVHNSHILPGLQCIGGPTGMTGGALEWLMRKKAWDYDHLGFKNMVKNWQDLKAAESGLFILSSLTGARVPDWNPQMRGTIVGLKPEHDFEEIYKATFEGIAFNTKRIINKIESLVGPVQALTAIGGGAKNMDFLQTRATIAGAMIVIPKEIEASTIGVLALAGFSLKWYHTMEEALSRLNPTEKVIEPSVIEMENYSNLYEKYNKLTNLMNGWYSK